MTGSYGVREGLEAARYALGLTSLAPDKRLEALDGLAQAEPRP